MRAGSAAFDENANCCGGESFRRSGSMLPLKDIISAVAERLWPSKTDHELAGRTKTSDRACRDVLRGRSSISGETLARLLRSEEGLEFLTAMMADARPAWWRSFEVHKATCDARLLERAAKRRLREAMHAYDDLVETIDRAETTIALRGQNKMCSRVDARSKMAGSGYRAVAAQAKGR